jgi:REP element-mobilizing transposase RayT
MPRLEVPAGTYFINFASLDRDDSFSPAERDAIFKVIRDGHRTSYVLNAVVVMPDHVHLILQAVVSEEPVELRSLLNCRR